jgi:predicted GIY-YIG superfamily endonuclease
MPSGRIYKLQCSDGKFYIGFTTKTLKQRLAAHKYKSNEAREQTRRLYKHILNIGWDNVTMELLQEVEYDDKKEIMGLENQFIENAFADGNCLNSGRSCITI